MQADLSLSSLTMQLTIDGLGQSQTIKVVPRQHLTGKWKNYASGTDLRKAKSSTGKTVFADTAIPDLTLRRHDNKCHRFSPILMQTDHMDHLITEFCPREHIGHGICALPHGPVLW